MRIIRQQLVIVVILASIFSSSFAQNVTTNGTKFRLNNSDFFPYGFNYKINIVVNSSGELLVGPYHIHYPNQHLTSDNQTGLSGAINEDLLYARDMLGANTVRIVTNGEIIVDANNNVFFDTPELLMRGPGEFSLEDPIRQVYDKDTYWGLIERVVDIIDDLGMKVIILKGPPNSPDFYSDFNNIKEINAQILGDMAEYFQGNTTLMGIDLHNEPLNHLNKCEVTEIYNYWIQAIKIKDSQRLVTIGFWIDAVQKYDPTLLNFDFYAFHSYGVGVEGDDFNVHINKVLGEIMFASKQAQVCNKPFMLGETGMSVHSDLSWILDDGTPSQQYEFVERTVNLAYDCGIPYLWWFFLDDKNNFPKSFFGTRDINRIPKSNGIETLFKNLRDAHGNTYGSGGIVPFDRFNRLGSGPYSIKGKLINTSGTPIDGGLVEIRYNTGGNNKYDWTYSLNDGSFQIYTNENNLTKLAFHALGKNSRDVTSLLPKDITINTIVELNETEIYNSIRSVNIINFYVKGNNTTGGFLEINSWDDRIVFPTGAKVDKGGKLKVNPFHLNFTNSPYTLANQSPCPQFKSAENLLSNQNRVEELFQNNSFLSVYPNPADEILIIEINNCFDDDIMIKDLHLINSKGLIIRHFRNVNHKDVLDISRISSGIYFLKYKISNKMEVLEYIHPIIII